jgi:integrase
VRAVKAWLAESGITAGAIFRPIDRHGTVKAGRLTGEGACQIIKRLVGTDFSGHSLRAGLVTAAAKANKSAAVIMKQTGHKSLAMVSRYIRDAELFTDNAASGIGL